MKSLILILFFSLNCLASEKESLTEFMDKIQWSSLFSSYKINEQNLEQARSPFTPLVVAKKLGEKKESKYPLTLYDLSQLKLIGVLWSEKNSKAMILAPDHKIYTVSKNDPIGIKEGYVSKIEQSSVEITEKISSRGKQTASKKLLKLK